LIGLSTVITCSTSEGKTVLVSTYSKRGVLWMAAYFSRSFPIIN